MENTLIRTQLMKRKKDKILVLDNIDEISAFALDRYRALASENITQRGRFIVAFSGGRTPAIFMQKLATKKELPWQDTHIFIADERFVSFADESSNYRMIKQNLLSKIDIPAKNIHPIYTGYKDVNTAAQKYAIYIRDFFGLGENQMPVFDLVMLGLGADGHTASLFPQLEEINKNRLTIAADIQEVQHQRISLSLGAVNNAREIIFLISGKEKADIVKRVVKGKDEKLPAARVSSEKGSIYFLIDRPAAKFIL